MTTTKAGTLFLKRVPRRLYRAFKAHCARAGVDVGTRAAQLMAEAAQNKWPAANRAYDLSPLVSADPQVTVLLRNVPADVKRAFKSWCWGRGAAMREKLITLMRAAALADGKERGFI